MTSYLTFKLLTIFIFAGIIALNAQNDTIKYKKYSTIYTLAVEQGSMLGNGMPVGDEVAKNTYYNGLNFRVGLRENDYNDVYNAIYRLPEMGFGGYLSTFHRNDIGNPFALYYFFKIPINYERNRRINFSYLAGLGVASNFNPYDKHQNPKNVFLGSITNAYINFKFQASYNFSNHWSTTLGLGFKHFSNGGTEQPNKGINLIPLSIAVNYKPNAYKVYESKPEIPNFINYNTFNVAWIAGTHDSKVTLNQHFKTALSINYLRAIHYKYRLGVGLDMFFTGAAGKLNNSETTFSNSVSVAAVGSWEWVITKNIYVPLAIGFYLHRNPLNGETKFFYERAGIRYRFNNNLFCGVAVKAHLGAAEFVEWTVGYSIFKDPNKYNK